MSFMNIEFSIEYKTLWGENLFLCTAGERYPMEWSDGGIWKVNLSPKSKVMDYSYELVRDGRTVRREWYGHRLQFSPRQKKQRDWWISKPTEDKSRRMVGTAVPVFSLRSEDDFGVGEFQDIKKLVDWAVETGQSIIQLLPINDTTMEGSWRDSYPYNANTAFALHPMYLNLPKAGLVPDEEYERSRKKLNSLKTVDYEAVNLEKRRLSRKLYERDFPKVRKTSAYRNFVAKNRDWLVPYALYSSLRDKFGTADLSRWGEYSVYNDALMMEYAKAHRPETDYYCYLQYLLDAQLSDVVAYAHEHKVVLKGDLPIGISRNSADVWMHPELFNLDYTTGAPPDAFAVDGQNWGFPTYNWEAMSRDGYAWWKARLRKMSEYFDAFRIDHILGFFRIWEIPASLKSGLMGHFSPALPYSENELRERGFDLSEPRYSRPVEGEDYRDVLFIEDPRQKGRWHPRIFAYDTNVFRSFPQSLQESFRAIHEEFFYHRHNDFWRESAMAKLPSLLSSSNMLACGEDLGMIPACVPEVMDSLGILSLEIQRMPKRMGEEFGNPADYPYMSVCTCSTHDMSPIRAWWEEDHELSTRFYRKMLSGQAQPPLHCSTEICGKILLQHLSSPSMFAIFPIQDWLSIDAKLRFPKPSEERINVPADSNNYWRYRMHLTLDKLLDYKEFSAKVRKMVVASGRCTQVSE